jgi:hypothetical protein
LILRIFFDDSGIEQPRDVRGFDVELQVRDLDVTVLRKNVNKLYKSFCFNFRFMVN